MRRTMLNSCLTTTLAHKLLLTTANNPNLEDPGTSIINRRTNLNTTNNNRKDINKLSNKNKLLVAINNPLVASDRAHLLLLLQLLL